MLKTVLGPIMVYLYKLRHEWRVVSLIDIIIQLKKALKTKSLKAIASAKPIITYKHTVSQTKCFQAVHFQSIERKDVIESRPCHGAMPTYISIERMYYRMFITV